MKASYRVLTDRNGENIFKVNSRVKADRKFGKTSIYGAGWAVQNSWNQSEGFIGAHMYQQDLRAFGWSKLSGTFPKGLQAI